MNRPAYSRSAHHSTRGAATYTPGREALSRIAVTRALCDALDVEGFLLDAKGRVIEQFCGRNAGAPELRGRPFEEVCAAVGCASVRERVQAGLHTVQSGEALEFSLEYEARTEGEGSWRRIHVAPIPGYPGRTLMAVDDVSARRSAELALEITRRQYTLAARAAQLAVWDCNLESREVLVDPGLKSLLGYLDREIGDTIDDWNKHIVQEDLVRIEERWAEHLAASKPLCEVEYRIRHRDGSVRWFLTRGMLVERSRGKPIRAVGTTMDITERKRAEAATSAARAASRRRKRTIRRLALQLLCAQQAERRRIGEELHDDICQRIAALEISVSNLLRGSAPDRHELEEVRERLSRLSDDVRRLSHDMNPPDVPGVQLVSRLRSHIDELARLGQLDVQLEARNVPSDLPDDTAVCLYRIAQEALRNIARHASTHTAHIALRAHRGGIALTIADAGRGFDVVQSSVGVGLSGIRHRIERLHGRLEIASSPGEGTRITAWLPCPRA